MIRDAPPMSARRWLRDPRADEIDLSLPPDARFVHARLGAGVVVS